MYTMKSRLILAMTVLILVSLSCQVLAVRQDNVSVESTEVVSTTPTLEPPEVTEAPIATKTSQPPLVTLPTLRLLQKPADHR
jgi:hypothetical protein